MTKEDVLGGANSTNTNSTTSSELVVNYKISANTSSPNISSNIKLVVNYQIPTHTDSTNRTSTNGNKLVISYQISTIRIQLILMCPRGHF